MPDKNREFRKEGTAETDRHFVHEDYPENRVDRLTRHAVESLFRKRWAETGLKEPVEAGQNNRNLARETATVVSSEWELFVTE